MKDSIISDMKSLQEQLAKTQRELTLLHDISNAMRTTLELEHILYIILTAVTAHTGLGFNRALLFLVNPKERTLEGTMAIGPESGEDAQRIWRHIDTEKPNLDDLIASYKLAEHAAKQSDFQQAIRALKVPLNADDGGLLATAYINGTPVHITPDRIMSFAHDPLLNIFHTTEVIIMPLKAKDKVNGLIVADNLYTRKPITADNLKIFTMLANQAGLAIENSRLYELFVHKSRTDSLTGLWNHGFFQDALTLEIEKAKNAQAHMSVLMIDIDNFKKFNDNFGHRNGDTILAELAKILKELSREADYVCRYGGEEFAVVLPSTSKDQAHVIAERMRERIQQYTFSSGQFPPELTITVSIGAASFPLDGITKEDLTQKADKAMYTAKFIGKNKTCLAGE